MSYYECHNHINCGGYSEEGDLCDLCQEEELENQRIEPSVPEGWTLKELDNGSIKVAYSDGSGVVIRDAPSSTIAEILFHRMMKQML